MTILQRAFAKREQRDEAVIRQRCRAKDGSNRKSRACVHPTGHGPGEPDRELIQGGREWTAEANLGRRGRKGFRAAGLWKELRPPSRAGGKRVNSGGGNELVS